MNIISFFQINKWKYLFFHIDQLLKINKYYSDKIESSGIEEGIPFVRFKNGKIFYSHKTESYQKRFLFLLKKDIREKVKIDCLNVLFDLLFRYEIPSTEKALHKTGKYYDFKEGETIVEIGAYVGYYALKASEIVGDKGLVLAIEAIPENYEILKRNATKNNRTNIRVVNSAVWSKKEVLHFNVNNKQKNSAIDNVIEGALKREIPADTLDNILTANNAENPNFIRIQVNGAELDVLKGMQKTIETKPKLLVAVPYRNRKEVLSFLVNKGYKIKEYSHSIFAF